MKLTKEKLQSWKNSYVKRMNEICADHGEPPVGEVYCFNYMSDSKILKKYKGKDSLSCPYADHSPYSGESDEVEYEC